MRPIGAGLTLDRTAITGLDEAQCMMSDADPINIGVVGCANIARQFTRDLAASQSVRVVAVASRDAAKSAAFANAFGLPRHFSSYEALFADAGIDAVYLPLPNSLHVEWAIKAAEAGKHVLCEKPLAPTRAEAETMFAAARRSDVVLLESYPYLFQPQTLEMISLLRSGAIGDVRSIQASFGFTVLGTATNIRLQGALGGGATLDAGSYPVSLARLVMGEAPIRVAAYCDWAAGGVDLSSAATLFYSRGRKAQIHCAMNVASHRRATIIGSHGTMETEYLNQTAARVGDNPFGYLPCQLRVRRGTASSIPFEEVRASTGSGFVFAAEAFAKFVRHREKIALQDLERASVDVAATLEAILRSGRTGGVVEL